MLTAKFLDNGRSTICLLPLVAMHIQYRQCATTFSIDVESWTPKTSTLVPPTLVLATIDQAGFPLFKRYVNILISSCRLARVVIDEAHLILTHADFRPIMKALQWLASISVPIVVMTATLPPTLEAPLFMAIGITSAITIRAPTPRANISFQVVRSQSDIEDTLEEEFNKALAFSPNGRILIFCLSIREATLYSDKFNIPVCHSHLDFEELNSILDRFRHDPKTRAIATTSILGVGLNIPNVTHTIHASFPRDVVSFIQEAGRAGRAHGNPPAFSIIILPEKTGIPKFPTNDPFGQQVLYRSVVNDSECRRIAVQSFLDGTADPCTMLPGNTHLCDVCERESLDLPASTYFVFISSI